MRPITITLLSLFFVLGMSQNTFSAVNEKTNEVKASSATLSENERLGLIQIREEEKLAGDVYSTLYKKWGLNPFANIEKSERTHMDAIKRLLDVWNIPDPVTTDSIGVFKSPEMTELYTKLTTKGLQSLDAALSVAAEIEELDIKDIHEFLETTNKDTIKVTYQNLIKGSRNHLRTFTSQLERRGKKYIPTHISKDYYDRIVTSRGETGAIVDPEYKF